MTTLAQRSMAAGEVAPAIYARTDQVKHATGLRTCRNFIVDRHGTVANRPGSSFVAEVKDSSDTGHRLIPFVFNTAQTYVLEFGDLYMRVIQGGAQLTDTSEAITGATQANPVVLTIVGHSLVTGQEVQVSGVAGMTELNGRNLKVGTTTATTVELIEMDGTTTLDGTAFGTYTSGGLAKRVFEIATPYTTAQVGALQFVQSADVMTIVHPSHDPRELKRLGDTSWTLTTIVFAPEIARPTGVSASNPETDSLTLRYQVTAVSSDLEESLVAREGTTKTVTGATQANPVVITTSAAHGFTNGDKVLLESLGGTVELNAREFVIGNVAATTFELVNEDGTGQTAFTSGGTAQRINAAIVGVKIPTSAKPATITWTAVGGAIEYNVYKEENGIWGFAGKAGGTTFTDDGIEPDLADTPPDPRDPLTGTGDRPATVTRVQGRLVYAGSDNFPERVFMSRTGFPRNFTLSNPPQTDDAITFEADSRQVNRIQHLIEIGAPVMLTSGGEWSIRGDNSDVLKADQKVKTTEHSTHGSTNLRPIVIDDLALFVQAEGSVIRSLVVTDIGGYQGEDISIFSSHLLDGKTIIDWSFQEVPLSIVWMVRSDGVLLGLTFIREHRVAGWHRHDFDGGTAENVASVPEGTETSTYVLVKRTVDGRTVRYINRFETRLVTDVKDVIFMDSALSFDGRNTTTSHTMTVSGGPTWEPTDTLTLTSSTGFFTADDVGNEIQLTGADGSFMVFEIDAFTSPTVVTGRPDRTVPSSLQDTATSVWTRAVDEIGGLWHLEGENLSVLGDGGVEGSPNNADNELVTVTNGVAQLSKPYGVIHAGLPYLSDILTLDIDIPGRRTLIDRSKLIRKQTLVIESSRGIWVGRKAPTDDSVDPLEGLREYKARTTEGYDDPVVLKTGTVDVRMTGSYNDNGRVFTRQVDPLPLRLLAIVPSGRIPAPR